MGPEEKGWGCRRAELTHRHVGACSNKGVGHGIYELATHTEVTQLDLSARVDQDVGGLDIYVADRALTVTRPSPSHCRASDTHKQKQLRDTELLKASQGIFGNTKVTLRC